jgi:cold shock CspA family protein
VEIKVEIADETAAFSFVVPDAEDFDVFVPGNVVGFSGGYERQKDAWEV